MTNENFLGNTGIQNREELWIFDSTKIQSFMDSPAKFFYNHILGWKPDKPNIHLVFGTAIHKALEHIQLYGYTPQRVAEGAEIFLSVYRESFPNEAEWEVFAPKTPDRAVNALFDYPSHFSPDEEQILYTEIAGTVPISHSRILHFKQDTVLLAPEGFWSREHKTTKYFSTTWEDQWKVKFQVGTYSLVMHILEDFLRQQHGDFVVQGVQINGFSFKMGTKKDPNATHEFRRIPIFRTEEQLKKFIWVANHWYDQIEWNIERLLECSPSSEVMTAFPCNGESCSKYGCPFSDFCETWNNPLQFAETPPIGYRVEHWDPRRTEDDATNILVGSELVKKTEVQ